VTEPIVVGARNISHSQLSHKCGLALKFHRQRVPWPSRGIALLYGTGLHAGLEEWHTSRDLDKAIKAGERALMAEILKTPPVRWDVKKGPAHKAAIPDLLTAQGMLRKHLTAWHQLRTGWVGTVIDLEANVWVDLTKFDKPWKLQCRIDAVVIEEAAKGILDYKSSGKAWTAEKLEEHKSQAYLYMGAEWFRSRVAPDWFEFIVFIKGTNKIEFHRFPFDAKTINGYLENVVRPTILTIEAGAFIANTDFWGHDARWCEYWSMCPMGLAANPVTEEVA
jgi:hypothetical protein